MTLTYNRQYDQYLMWKKEEQDQQTALQKLYLFPYKNC